jgi:hypothetical protein
MILFLIYKRDILCLRRTVKEIMNDFSYKALYKNKINAAKLLGGTSPLCC